MEGQALGLLEVQGYSVALAAMNQACKAANIVIHGMDCNNPAAGDAAFIPVLVQVKFSGSISDVQVALETAKRAACQYISEELVLTSCIPSMSKELEPLLAIGKVKQKG